MAAAAGQQQARPPARPRRKTGAVQTRRKTLCNKARETTDVRPMFAELLVQRRSAVQVYCAKLERCVLLSSLTRDAVRLNLRISKNTDGERPKPNLRRPPPSIPCSLRNVTWKLERHSSTLNDLSNCTAHPMDVMHSHRTVLLLVASTGRIGRAGHSCARKLA